MAQATARTGLAEHLAAIAAAVVGHDPLDHHAMAGKPGEGTLHKAGGGFLALVRQDFAVGQPTGVIDADMQALPTNPVMPIDRAGAAPGDAMAKACEKSAATSTALSPEATRRAIRSRL